MKHLEILVIDTNGEVKDKFVNYDVKLIEANAYEISGELQSSYSSTTQLDNIVLEERDSEGNILRKFEQGFATKIKGLTTTFVVIQALLNTDIKQ